MLDRLAVSRSPGRAPGTVIAAQQDVVSLLTQYRAARAMMRHWASIQELPALTTPSVSVAVETIRVVLPNPHLLANVFAVEVSALPVSSSRST
jgi:hypothetical protein